MICVSTSRTTGTGHSADKPFAEVFPSTEGRALAAAMHDVMASGIPFSAKALASRLANAGKPAFLDLVLQPVRGADGQIAAVMSFAIDVTSEVQARRDLEGLTEELQRALRAREEFLGIAGHELKTPLTALKLQLQGLERRSGALGAGTTLTVEFPRS